MIVCCFTFLCPGQDGRVQGDGDLPERGSEQARHQHDRQEGALRGWEQGARLARSGHGPRMRSGLRLVVKCMFRILDHWGGLFSDQPRGWPLSVVVQTREGERENERDWIVLISISIHDRPVSVLRRSHLLLSRYPALDLPGGSDGVKQESRTNFPTFKWQDSFQYYLFILIFNETSGRPMYWILCCVYKYSFPLFITFILFNED